MSKIHFLVLTIVLVCFGAHARSPIMSHDRFVYLTDSEQEQVIIKTMEFVVELEESYQYEVATYGYNENRYRLYTSMMRKVVSFLMNEAHADTTNLLQTQGKGVTLADALPKPKDTTPLVLKQPAKVEQKVPASLARPKKSWEQLADEFYKNVTTKSSSKCIYAGWVSEMQGKPALCVHPSFINPKSPGSVPESMTYAQQDGCTGRNQITCNPVIFGYKSESEKSLFCVPAGIPESHNSALNCMKAALSDTAEAKTDSKEKRLQHLRERLVAKPDAFANVQKFIYQYCICETSPDGTNKEYHDRIRPHRTCFGMIEMVAETSICEEPKIDIDTTIFKKLRDAATSGKISKSSGGGAIDAFYKKFLKDVKTSAPSEYQALCPNDTMPTKPEEKKPEIVAEPKSKYTCVNVLCMIPPVEQGEKKEEKPGEPKFGCIYNFSNGEEVAYPDEVPNLSPENKDVKEIKVKVGFDKKPPQELTCPVTFEESPVVADPAPSKKPGIKLELKEKSGKSQNVHATTTDRGSEKIVWKRIGFNGEKKTTKTEEKKSELKIAGLDEEEKKPEEKKPEEKKPEDKGTEILSENENKEDVSVPIITSEYKVCADLVGDDGNSVGSDCVTIPKGDEVKAPPIAQPINRGAASQQPQMPSRMGNDTSAMGIK
ncbi:hypothetical protein [Peredibacter starrii]|uniref:Uncharacterized protein n=1 Tax=Peredibacter starrii TaxID=28202 RepID=A0AAX4HKI3_9BACT|nr:hypothetical protein [Peredibacter starrii]WPU63745.1 hypothetical protein SOO65_13705 [Peredibacter starrii]